MTYGDVWERYFGDQGPQSFVDLCADDGIDPIRELWEHPMDFDEPPTDDERRMLVEHFKKETAELTMTTWEALKKRAAGLGLHVLETTDDDGDPWEMISTQPGGRGNGVVRYSALPMEGRRDRKQTYIRGNDGDWIHTDITVAKAAHLLGLANKKETTE